MKMNRFIALAALLAVLILSCGCGGRPRPGAAAQAETDAGVQTETGIGVQTEADAGAQTETGIGVKAETDAGALGETVGNVSLADGCEKPLRRNEACLAMFELTGPVRSCHVECWQTGTADGEYEQPDMMWSRNYGFNRQGYLEIDGCTEYTYRADTVFLYGEDAQAGMSASLTFDAAGRIVAQILEYEGEAVGDGERSAEFSYDDAGRLTRSYTVFWETEMETFYGYDALGRLETCREAMQNYDGGAERIYTYEYVKFDEYGNWTQRKVTVKSTATQPVEGYEHERSEVVRAPDAYRFESREITYYE